MENETETESREEILGEAPSLDEVDETIGDPYCFESDSVALKTNPDYHRLLKTICLLEAQRTRAIQDLEQLYAAKEQVLQDPIGFVDRLQRTGNLGIALPGPQTITELPVIDWQKYTNRMDFKMFGTYRQSARLKSMANNNEDEQLRQLKFKLERGSDLGDSTQMEGFVRGRYKDESKPESYNRLWTSEEQKKLDEELIKNPPEAVEANRWRKISAAFGNRTPQQIASRVQKYFQKLEINQLEVPGRVPNRVVTKAKRGGRNRQRQNWKFRESTFLQRYNAPVVMREDWEEEGVGENVISSSSSSAFMMEEDPGPSSYHPSQPHLPQVAQMGGAGADGEVQTTNTQQLSDNEDIPEELCHTAEYRELTQLKKLRKEKLTTVDPSLSQHIGYKCDRCGCGPIVGVRYHCVDCPQSTSLDFCEPCFPSVGTVEVGCHNSSHRIRPVKRTWSKQTTDQDYLHFNTNGKDASNSQCNYLDPNYMPAV